VKRGQYVPSGSVVDVLADRSRAWRLSARLRSVAANASAHGTRPSARSLRCNACAPLAWKTDEPRALVRIDAEGLGLPLMPEHDSTGSRLSGRLGTANAVGDS
jgi:hypothetical protein